MSMVLAADDATVERLVLRFDVGFDTPLKHGECLGRLQMLGAFDLGEELDNDSAATSVQRLAEQVGAYWCRIVHDDVTYRIVQGLEAVEESRPEAETLAEQVLLSSSGGLPALCAYAAARWYDGAGKIYFRMGDYATARLSFDKAVQLAKHAGLDRCLPDIRSNQVRAAFDENEMVGSPKPISELRMDYELLEGEVSELLKSKGFDRNETKRLLSELWGDLNETITARADVIRAHGIGRAATEAFATRCAVPWDEEERELWRGYCSVLHNFSIAQKGEPAGVVRSMQTSQDAAAIAWALSDSYRLAQALNHQAQLSEGAKEDVRAELLCQVVLMLGWRRGRRIAEQMLARIDGRRRNFPAAMSRLSKLFEQIRVDRSRRGGDLGVDVLFQRYTVGALATVLKDAGPFADVTEYGEARELHDSEESEAVRSVRRVVKVATYKSAYAKHIHPFFLRRVEQCVHPDNDGPQRWMEGISLVEESSSRELLDVLCETSRPRSLGKHALGRPVSVPASHIVTPPKRPDVRSGVRSVSAADDAEMTRAFRAQRAAFERAALTTPIDTVPHNEEIGFDLRRFTAAHEGMCIVRYFFYGEQKGAPASLGAYVFRDGVPPSFTELDLQAARSVARHIDEDAKRERERDKRFALGMPCPNPYLAETLWDVFFEPIWRHIAGVGASGKSGGKLPSHLVLIPSGELFRLPLHIALVPNETPNEPDTPLCACVPVSFSTSATSFVSRGRYLLAKQPIDDTDDLCILAPKAANMYPSEIESLRWAKEHFHVAGMVPAKLAEAGGFTYWGKGDRDGIARLIAEEPEIFVFSGHGLLHGDGDLGLQLEDGVLSHYEIPTTMRLPRNKLAVLAACVTGQGANVDGGEVSGFLRAFMAAGAGVLGVSLWSVDSDLMAAAVQALLEAAAPGAEPKTFNAVQALHEHYKKQMMARNLQGQERLAACPLALYL